MNRIPILFLILILFLSWLSGQTYNIKLTDGTRYRNCSIKKFVDDVLTIKIKKKEYAIHLNNISAIGLNWSSHSKKISPVISIFALTGAVYTGYRGVQMLDDWFDFKLSEVDQKTAIPVGIWLILSSAPGAVIGYFTGMVIGGSLVDRQNAPDFRSLPYEDQCSYIQSIIKH